MSNLADMAAWIGFLNMANRSTAYDNIDDEYPYMSEVKGLLDNQEMSDIIEGDVVVYYLGQPEDPSAGMRMAQDTPAFTSRKALDDWCRDNIELVLKVADEIDRTGAFPDKLPWSLRIQG